MKTFFYHPDEEFEYKKLEIVVLLEILDRRVKETGLKITGEKELLARATRDEEGRISFAKDMIKLQGHIEEVRKMFPE